MKHRKFVTRFLTAFTVTPALLLAQGGLVPNGDFEGGTTGWKKLRFDDPAGRTGVGSANVAGQGISKAIFADFRSGTRLSHCDWLSQEFTVPPGTFPVRFAVMWQKPTASQVNDPSGNYMELNILDSRNQKVFSGHVPVPRQTGLLLRRSFQGTVRAVVPTRYKAHIIMRHSEKAGMAYVAWMDDILVGSRSWSLYGAGCPGSGSFVPSISGVGNPAVGSNDWRLELVRAHAPSVGLVGLGNSRSQWGNLTLPIALGGGCQVLTGYLLAFTLPVQGSGPGTGRATLPLPIPGNAAVRGLVLHAQWVIADPGSASPVGVTVTEGLSFQIQ